MLTQKQESYVQELIKGKTQRQAYKASYPNSFNYKTSSIDELASRLFKKAKVKARYDELNQKHLDKAIMTKDEVLRGLKKAFYIALGVEPSEKIIKKIVDEGIETINHLIVQETDLKAIPTIAHQICKLEGWEIDRIEHSGKVQSEISIVKKIEDYEKAFDNE